MSYSSSSAEVKNRADIADWVGARVKLTQKGRNLWGLCPFHAEKTSSFSVNTQLQIFKCFGCGASGDVFEFVMRTEGLEFRGALERVAERYGIALRTQSPEDNRLRKQQQALFDVLAKATDFYSRQLREPSARSARKFLDQRGIGSQQVAQFQLGYAPRGSQLLRELGETNRQLLLDAGLIRLQQPQMHQGRTAQSPQPNQSKQPNQSPQPNQSHQPNQSPQPNQSKQSSQSDPSAERYYDFFRDRLMFPIQDNRGRVIAFGGRRLDGGSQAKYINSPETVLFKKEEVIYGVHQVRQTQLVEEMIIVEGYMDVLALFEQGWSNAVAVMGTAFGAKRAQQLFRLATANRLVLCFDGDAAGQKACERAVMELAPELDAHKELRLMFLPEGEDPDSLLRTGGSADAGRRAFQACLEAALPLSDYLLASVPAEASAEAKSRALSKAMAVLNRMTPTPYRTLLHQALAQHCQLPIAQLELNATSSAARTVQGARPQGSAADGMDSESLVANTPSRDDLERFWHDMDDADDAALAPDTAAIPADSQDSDGSELAPRSGMDIDTDAPTQLPRTGGLTQQYIRHAIYSLLIYLLSYPAIASELSLDDELLAAIAADKSVPELAFLIRLLTELHQNPDVHFVLGQLQGGADWQESWDEMLARSLHRAHPKQAATLQTQPENLEQEGSERARRIWQSLVQYYSSDPPLIAMIKGYHAGDLGRRQKRRLWAELNQRLLATDQLDAFEQEAYAKLASEFKRSH
ncbi:MAG: CHC2 zinc finger domain-containing protein [Gammaproteobacteria bacterium]